MSKEMVESCHVAVLTHDPDMSTPGRNIYYFQDSHGRVDQFVSAYDNLELAAHDVWKQMINELDNDSYAEKMTAELVGIEVWDAFAIMKFITSAEKLSCDSELCKTCPSFGECYPSGEERN